MYELLMQTQNENDALRQELKQKEIELKYRLINQNCHLSSKFNDPFY